MGGCCGKGAAPNDGDKTPYRPTEKPAPKAEPAPVKEPASPPPTTEPTDAATTEGPPPNDQVQAAKQEKYDVPKPIKVSPTTDGEPAINAEKPPPVPTSAPPGDSDEEKSYPDTKPYEVVDLKLGKHPFAKNAAPVKTDDVKTSSDKTVVTPEAAPRTTSLPIRHVTPKDKTDATPSSPATTGSSTLRYDVPSATFKYDVPGKVEADVSPAKPTAKPRDEVKTSDISLKIADTPDRKPAERSSLTDRARPAPSIETKAPATKTSFMPVAPYIAARKSDVTPPESVSAKSLASPVKAETTSPLASADDKSPLKTDPRTSINGHVNAEEPEVCKTAAEVVTCTAAPPMEEPIPAETTNDADASVNGTESTAISGALQYLQEAEDEITKMQEESAKRDSEKKPTVVITTTTTSKKITPETLPKPKVAATAQSTDSTTPESPPATKSGIPVPQVETGASQVNKAPIARTTSKESKGNLASPKSPKSNEVPSEAKGKTSENDTDNSVHTPTSPTPADSTKMTSPVVTRVDTDLSKRSPSARSSEADELPCVVSPPADLKAAPPSFPDTANGEMSPAKHVEADSTQSAGDEQKVVQPEPIHVSRMRVAAKELLIDLRPSSDVVIAQHQLCTNTRVKHLQTIAAWLADEAAANAGSGDDDGVPRSMVIVGRPGIGKTCLVAEVVRRYGSQVAGYHFFNYNSAHPDHNDPCAALLSLAHHMCDVFPNYVAMLPTEDKLEALIAQGNICNLYDALIARPLMSPELEHGADRRMLIVIDALDECSVGEREALLDIINDFNDNSPDWLYLLVTTTTPTGQVDDDLENIVVLEMKTSSENLVDIKRYLKEPLGLFMDRISLDGGLTTLAKKTHGNFLCARLYATRLRSLPRDRRVALREVDALLPTGFGDTLREIFRNLHELLSQDASTSEADAVYADVIGILALAREPLHRYFVTAVCGDDIDGDALFAELSDVICSPTGPDHVCFIHRAIGDWLVNESKAGDCAINKAMTHARLADMCTDALCDIVGDNPAKPEALAGLRQYALKHAIEHLTDTPKRQTTIARLMCSLTYVADKIKLDDVNVRHVIADYAHEHFRMEEDAKLVTLAGYMKKQPKLADDIGNYAMFVQRKGPEIDACPDSVNNVAANYPSCPAIAEAARSSISGRPWLEELTAMPLTSCLSRPMRAHVCGFDVSPDYRTIAVLCKDDDYNLSLRLISTATLDDRVPPVDVKDLPERVGLAVRFMPDNASVFVGSLTTYVTTKGRAVPTGYETGAIDLAERYSIESCDVSARHFACALTTFPWGGRSLHLAIFDQRTKRCLRTLEVLRFRFGGSAQFGIRACALSDEHHLMCAAVKQTTKPELKVYVWDTARWTIIGSVFVDGDSISKCAFVGASTVMLGSGVRSTVADKYGEIAVRVRAVTWKFRSEEGDGSAAESCVPLEAGEMTSVFCCGQGTTTSVSWSSVAGSAVVSVWHDANVPNSTSALYRVRGLPEMLDMTTCGKMMTFISSDELRMYRFDDLEAANMPDDSGNGVAALADMCVCNVSFQPRTDVAFLVQADADDTCSVSTLEIVSGCTILTSTPFQKEPNPSGHCTDRVGQFRCFRGPRSSLDVCCASLDGNFVVFNSGRRIKVWNRAEDSVTELPETPDEQCDEFAQCTRIGSLVAPKDATVAVIYGQLPFRVFFYDLKSGRMLRKLGLHGRSDRERVVSDLAYLPSTGYLATYHRDFGNTLAVWNPRNGQQINKQEAAIGYAKASPASDRIIVSLRETNDDGDGGALLLRNADGRFRSNLQLPAEWPPEGELSDVDFSVDGTTLVGVCVQAGVCRVWNAGNGEVLRDLSPGFVGGAEIVGMVTNTHVLFHDERLLAVDIASGDVVVALPVDQLERKLSARGVRIAPRGSFVIGADAAGQVALFLCHNFTAAQRSTTLQRMKSFTKKA